MGHFWVAIHTPGGSILGYQNQRELIERFLKKMRGESISVDVKKLKGKWKGYLRIKKGKLRVIFTVNFEDRVLYVERVDFRGKGSSINNFTFLLATKSSSS